MLNSEPGLTFGVFPGIARPVSLDAFRGFTMFWLLGGKGVRHGGCGDAAVIVQKTTIAAGGLNFDISDGWERDGEPEDYFKVFSEARAYPLGINIVFYLMTH